jgi:small subunit ribosomal protein S20
MERDMPKTKTAKKELRKSARNRVRNIERRDSMKRTIRDYRRFISAKKFDEAAAMLPKVMKALDKTAKTGFIKKGHADRLKSRLSKALAKLK